MEKRIWILKVFLHTCLWIIFWTIVCWTIAYLSPNSPDSIIKREIDRSVNITSALVGRPQKHAFYAESTVHKIFGKSLLKKEDGLLKRPNETVMEITDSPFSSKRNRRNPKRRKRHHEAKENYWN